MLRNVRRIAGVIVAAGASLGLLAASAPASAPRVAVGSVPRLPAAARATGAVPSSSRVQLTISLAPRDPLGMQAMVDQVSTPGSPLFRHYLTVAQFAKRFGATPARISAVRGVLRAQGLRVGAADANGLTLAASGTAAEVQSAFATSLSRVALASGRSAYANTSTPTLPASIAPDVDSVVGLNSLVRFQHDSGMARASAARGAAKPQFYPPIPTGGPEPCAQASGVTDSLGSYTADQVASAYNFTQLYGAGDLGAGQTIALYELQPLQASDVAAYQACYGVADSFSFVNVDHPSTYAKSPDDSEAALDADQIIGLAPQAKVIVYQAPNTASAGVKLYSKIVSQNAAKTISTSWGSCENEITNGGRDRSIVKAENHLFQEAALQGQTVLAASGDSGSTACADVKNRGIAVQDPSSQPYATGVGGTTLYTQTATGPFLWNPGVPLDESVWNEGVVDGKPSATGGGVSRLWAMPSYQSRAAAGLHVKNPFSKGPTGKAPCKSGYCREVPDISADGDPATGYVIFANGAWTAEGGTSAASPVWAALTALANALPSCRGLPIGFENPSLYKLAATAPGDLRDITLANPRTGSGNNDALGSTRNFYPVTPGYDMTTGLGTPNAAAVSLGMCGLRAPVYAVSVASPGAPRALLHTRYKLKIHAADSGGVKLSYAAKGLPKGLRIARKTGVISGKAEQGGSYLVTVFAEDFAANGGAVQFPLKVVTPPPRFSKVALTGVAHRRPQLTFTVTKGRFAAKLRSVTVRLPNGMGFSKSGRGVHLSAGHRVRFHVKLRDGAYTITFKSVQTRVTVRLARPTIHSDRALARKARHRAHVKVRLNATDRHKHTTRSSFRLRLPK